MRELKDIIADARENIMEACAVCYDDGLNMGLDMAIDERDARIEEKYRDAWCDGFIAGWNGHAGAEPDDTEDGKEDDKTSPEELIPNCDGEPLVYCTECKHYYVGERGGANEWLCLRHQIADPASGAYCFWGERK